MADEREIREAESKHRRAMDLVRGLRKDADYRLVEILDRYASRRMDDLSEQRQIRESTIGALVSLQRRIDETIRSL